MIAYPHFVAEADQHFTNLFVVQVGMSAKGRKGTSLGRIMELFKQIDPGWVMDRVQSGLSSGEGLIWAVRDSIEKEEPIREKRVVVDYQNVVTDPGITDKRLLVVEGEFASTLKVFDREGNTLSAVIRNAWDSGNLRTLTKTAPARSTGAHISIIAHITKDELIRYMHNTEAGNGFGNRFLWVCVKRSQMLPEGGNLSEADLTGLVDRIQLAVESAKGISKINRDERARRLWFQVYPALSEGKPGLLGALTARAEAQVTAICCTYKRRIIRNQRSERNQRARSACEFVRFVRFVSSDFSRTGAGSRMGGGHDMKPLAIVGALKRMGIHLSVSGGELNWRAPKRRITPAIRELIASHKNELMEIVSSGSPLAKSSAIDQMLTKSEAAKSRADELLRWLGPNSSHPSFGRLCADWWQAVDDLEDDDAIVESLLKKGFVVVNSKLLMGENVVVLRDENVSLPRKWTMAVNYTLDEIEAYKELRPDAIRELHEVKRRFGGRATLESDESYCSVWDPPDK